MTKIKLEHIDALSKGKKSGIRIGSRGIPHHLYAYEQDEYERALKRGYLTLDEKSRPNLENLWMLVAKTQGIDCIILRKKGGNATIFTNGICSFDGTLPDAKNYLKTLIL